MLPNFPGRNFQNNAKGMFCLNDGKDVVAPFMAGKTGDVVLKTVFQPTGNNKKFVESFTGVPPLSISGLRNNVPASAQPLGFSADVKPSMKNSMPEIPTSGKNKLPAIAGAGSGAGLTLWPADVPGYVNTEPGLEEAWNPAELPAAMVGVPGLAGKAAAAVLDPVLSYGMDQLGGLLDYFMREKK